MPTGGTPRVNVPCTEEVLSLASMKRAFLAIAVLIAICSLVLSCGGGGLSLAVEPASASIFTDYSNGTYQGVVLTATLSNGAVPTGLQWKTSQACVAVGNNTQNTTTVICNFTCGIGTMTATITASAQGLTGKSSVTCTWR